MKTNLEETLSYLKEMGFTEYEAKVYIALLNQHPASAYTVSQNSGVPHSRVYDITRRLIKKGVAISTGVKPELFSPLSPNDLVDKLRREYNQFTEELEERLKSVDFVSDFDPVWNLQNREKAFKMASDLISKAKSTISIGIWSEELPLLADSLRAASKRGVRVLTLIYGTDKLDFGETYNHDIENMGPVEKLGRTLDCVVDSEMCITGALGGNVRCQVIWTKNRGLVQSIESYIAHDFYLAEIHNHFGREIDEIFGRNLIKLRKKFHT